MRSRKKKKADSQQPAERTDKKKCAARWHRGAAAAACSLRRYSSLGRTGGMEPGELQPGNVEGTCTVGPHDHRVSQHTNNREITIVGNRAGGGARDTTGDGIGRGRAPLLAVEQMYRSWSLP